MKELSIFIDESGDAAFKSDFYLVTLVFHEQNHDIISNISRYEQALKEQLLDSIPFHFNPLINGNDDYKWKGLRSRKRQLAAFSLFVQHLPVSYATFTFEKRQNAKSSTYLAHAIERDVKEFLSNKFEYIQSFDVVKVYYDGGQSLVTRALHAAIESIVAQSATVYRDASPRTYRLAQVADYLCGIELTSMKFEKGTETKTDVEFFGSIRSFKKNYLKKVRKKLIV